MMRRILCLSLFFLFLAAENIPAQTAGALSGTSSSPTGQAIMENLALPGQARQLEVPGEDLSAPQQEEAAEEEKIQAGTASADEGLSSFEQYIVSGLPGEVSTNIRQFGYDLFRQSRSAFAPSKVVPVGPDYVIGPGDGLRIHIWGKIEGSWNAVVDRDGNIRLPKVGILGVTGLTFEELKSLLHKELSKYYTGFEMNVSLGSLRTIRVYIVGHAHRPGAYTVSSLATLVNALFQAGGPSKTGTLRDIQVKRDGEVATHFDLYDFLLQGDKSRDIRLLPEDVIYIPPVGTLVGIAGNVKKPAIYEVLSGCALVDLIRMAGGLTSQAFKGRIQVQRIEDHQYRTLFEGDLIDIERALEKNFTLENGDLIKIYPVVEMRTTIRISGAVANPGEYGITPGETRVHDVIPLTGGLLYYAADQAELTRVRVTQEGPRTERLHLNVAKALDADPEHDLVLEINDYLFIRNVPEWALYQTVVIAGEVKYPGTYTIKKGDRLSSLIGRAGGFTDKAYLRGSEFTRESVRKLQQEQINEMIDRLERELVSADYAQASTATSSEDFRLRQNEAEQKRQFIERLREVRAKGRIALRLLPPEQLTDAPHDIELEAGDTIRIPSDPRTVQVIGSVFNQTAFVYETGKNHQFYLDLAGGHTRHADTDNIYILKADGSALKVKGGVSPASSKWQWGRGTELASGDTIVVPERLERTPWMRNTKDVTQILYQIAVAAGVIVVAF